MVQSDIDYDFTSKLTVISAAWLNAANNTLNTVANVQNYGAKGDGVTDDTAAIQAAINTTQIVLFPCGVYLVTTGLHCPNKGQIFQGMGATVSTILVNTTFDFTCTQGVFIASSGEEGPQFQDFGVAFIQPDTSIRASLTQYPPAFGLRDTPRFRMNNIRIDCAMIGIDMKGNSGGAFINNLECSAFNIHIDIDGSLDIVRISNTHLWNFGVGMSTMTANQLLIYRDGSCVGIKVGTCDGLELNSVLMISNGPQLWMHPGVGGIGCFGLAVNCDFDTYASIKCELGQFRFSSCLYTTLAPTLNLVDQTGGWLSFTSCEFEFAAVLTVPALKMSGSSTIGTSPLMQVTNCQFRFAPDMTVFQAEETTGNSNLILIGNMFMNTTDLTYTHPVIWVKAGGRLTAIGNRITDKGVGTATFIKIDVDEIHVVTANAFTGWSFDVPTQQVLGVYQQNMGFLDAILNGNLVGPEFTRRLTGTLDGAGAVTVAHGVLAGALSTLFCQGFYKNGASAAVPLTITSVDNTNVIATGGAPAAGARYRIALGYSSSQQSPW